MRSDPGKIFKQRQELAISKSPRGNHWAITELISDHSISAGGKMQPTGKFLGETRTMFLLLSANLLGRRLSGNKESKRDSFLLMPEKHKPTGLHRKTLVSEVMETGKCYLEGSCYYRSRVSWLSLFFVFVLLFSFERCELVAVLYPTNSSLRWYSYDYYTHFTHSL